MALLGFCVGQRRCVSSTPSMTCAMRWGASGLLDTLPRLSSKQSSSPSQGPARGRVWREEEELSDLPRCPQRGWAQGRDQLKEQTVSSHATYSASQWCHRVAPSQGDDALQVFPLESSLDPLPGTP